MRTNGKKDTNSNSFDHKVYDLFCTFTERFSELKHYALALWIKALVEGLESQGFQLHEVLFALSEVLHEKGFNPATQMLEEASSSVLQQSRKNKENGPD